MLSISVSSSLRLMSGANFPPIDARRWRVFQEIGMYFYIEMREIVNSLYLKVEVHPKLLIFQSNFSGP